MNLKDTMLLRNDAYVDSRWSAARSGARFAVRNPATQDVLAEVADMDEADANDAIAAAARAFPAWRAKTAKERAMLLRAWFNLILANQEDLAPDDG